METNLQKYLAFVKTAEYNSFTRAAEVLNYTQSAISRMIRDLEEECGIPLLERSRSGVWLTTGGQQLLPYMRNLCQEYEGLQQQIDALQGLESGLIRIGAFSSVATHWIPPVMKAFRKDFPGIEYELLMGDYSEIEGWVLDGRADCGFLPVPANPRLHSIHLEDDELMVILPQNHPLADCSVFPLDALCHSPFIMPKTGGNNDVAVFLQAHGLSPDIICSTFDDYAIMSMVESGLGISILPRLMLRRTPFSIVEKSLEVPVKRSLSLILRSEKNAPPVVTRFLQYLQYRN